MKFTVLKENLENKLSIASRFCLSTLSSIHALTGALLTLSGNKLNIISTNLNDFFTTTIDVKGEKNGSIVADIKKIVEFLNFLPTGKIEVELVNNELIFKNNKTKGLFNTIEPGDFPSLPEGVISKFKFNKKLFTDNLPLVIFSAAHDNTRPVLTGINFAQKKEKIFIVATDGFRLSLVTLNDEQKIPAFIISATLLNEVLRLLGDGDELEFGISDTEKVVLFDLGQMRVYSRLIDGEFPPFEKVLPATYSTKIILDREEILKNIKMASIFARDFSSIVVLEIKKDGLYIRPRTKQERGSVIFQDTQLEGEEKIIAFNYKFILDFLNNTKDDKIIFEMTESNAPGVFKPYNNERFIHIIMPIRTEEEAS